MSSSQVWLISGCSSGFGEAIALAALNKGDRVIATCRGDAQARLSHLVRAGAAALSLDVTSSDVEVDSVVEAAFKVYGRLDILVNNAGYILQGPHEELTHAEERAEYETNVFGAFKLSRSILPYLRKQQSGVIFNMSSHCGRFARGAYGSYSSSKFALEGFSEALANETRHLGIFVCAVEPGAFQTQVLASNACKLPAPERHQEDYAEITGRVEAHLRNINGKQRGDPDKAAEIMADLASNRSNKAIPIRLALGSDAYVSIKNAYEEGLKDLEDWKDITMSTDRAVDR